MADQTNPYLNIGQRLFAEEAELPAPVQPPSSKALQNMRMVPSSNPYLSIGKQIFDAPSTPNPLAPPAPSPVPPAATPEDVEQTRKAKAASVRAQEFLERGVTPDVVAEIRKLARDTGQPLPLAAQTYVQRLQREKGLQSVRILQANPGLLTLLAGRESYTYADFTDDLSELATVENAFNTGRDAAVGAVDFLTSKAPIALANLYDDANRILFNSILSFLPEATADAIVEADRELTKKLRDAPIPLLPSDIVREPAEALGQLYDALDTPEDERTITTDIGRALGEFGGQALIYIMTGGTASVVTNFAVAADEQRARVEAAGADESVRGDIAILSAGAISAILDQYNLGLILDRLPASARSRLFRTLASGTSEGVTEFAQAVSQNLVAKGIYDADTGIITDEAAYEGMLGSIVGMIVGVATPRRRGGRVPKEMEDLLDAGALPSAQAQAEQAKRQLEITRAAIEETKTFVRDPEAVRELLEAAGDRQVTLPASEVETLYQEGVLTDDDIDYLQVRDELTQQGELSGDVTTSASRLLTLQGDKFSAVVDHVRTAPEQLTVAEARAAVEQRTADIDRLQATLEQAERAATEVEVLSEVILQQLEATGSLTRPQRRAAASLLAEAYAARAMHFGPEVTASTLYEADRLTFEGPEGRGEPPEPVPAPQPAEPEPPALSVDPEAATAILDAIEAGAPGQPVQLPDTAAVFEAIQQLGVPVAADRTVAAEDVDALLAAIQQELAAEQPGLPLFDAPLQIEGKVTVKAIGEAMTAAHMELYGRKLYPEDSAEDYATVLAVAREELDAQMQRPNSGHGWYSKDVDLAIQQTARILPGLDTKEGRAAFLTFAGIFSNGLTPQQAWQISIEAYEAWVATGEIIIKRADAARAAGREPAMTTYKDKSGKKVTKEAGWSPRSAANEQQLQMFKTLVEQQGGVTQALDWLANPQPREAINQLMADAGVKTPRFKTKAEREGPPTYGALIFSEKLGRYTLGLHGVEVGSEDTTVDLWYTRSYRRWTGRLLDKPLGKEGVAAQPDPARGGIERQTIFRLTGDLMQDYPGLTAGDVQAMLWFFEKRLWGAQGLKTDEGTNSAGARQALEARGLEFDERGGSVAESAGDSGATALEQAALAGGTGEYAGGSLAPLEGAPTVAGAAGPDPELVAVAERYAARNGIDLRRQSEFVEVDPDRAARIAQAYDEMEHAPQDPAVQEAYANLIAQTIEQYRALTEAGYVFTFFDGETDPYDGNPWNAMRDLRANKRMAVYGTYDGYGTEGLTQGAVDDNPMLMDTGLVWPDQNGIDRPVTANDLFRAVHDAFGHGIEGAGFRARGEENAWQAHVRLFTGSAVAAITSETRGQNSWLNYGPYGEQNRTAAVEDTVFADQKIGLMPEWTWTEGRAGDAPSAQELEQDATEASPAAFPERDLTPNAESLRSEGTSPRPQTAAQRAAAEAEGRDTEQPVTGDDLDRINEEGALEDFLARPGWGIVTATRTLPDDAFYRNQRENNPALYEMALQRQEAQNREQNERLRQQLAEQGIPFIEVEGMYEGQPDGTSFLIVADEATVTTFGKRYLQDSVLTRDGLIFTRRPQPDVPLTGQVVTGAEATQQDFYSILPDGTAFSLELAFGEVGAGIPRIPEGYSTRPDRPQLPVRPDGLVELYHWSGQQLAEVDPAFAGTGPLQGEERRRKARLSFFGVNPRNRRRSPGTGYIKEAGLGENLHVAFVHADRLYPWFEDPEGLVAAAGNDETAAEAAIREAGYIGHYVTDDGSARAPLGNVAALYEAVPVQPIEQPTFEQPKKSPQTKTKGEVGAPRGSLRMPTNLDEPTLLRLSTTADPSTFIHEIGHLFLHQMLRDLNRADGLQLTAEGRQAMEAQIAATRKWFGENTAQALSDLKWYAGNFRKRAEAEADPDAKRLLELRASRVEGAVKRAEAGGGEAYMKKVAAAFMDPANPDRDEAAELVFHELWARGFEKYVGTGQAPSADLRSLFSRFAKYITNVYKTLKRLAVDISPEITDVFDRLLASEEAIQEERRGAVYSLSPGILEGATAEEAAQLRALAVQAEEEAMTQMSARVANNLNQQRRAERRARRSEIKEEVTETIRQEPIYAAINLTTKGIMPDGTKVTTSKIDRAELVSLAGEDAVGRMPKGMVSGKRAPANPIPLADLATLAGFSDVDVMIDALTNPTPKNERAEIEARVEARMQAEFGEETNPELLQDEAIEAVQNTKFQQLQQLQLRILRRLAQQRLGRVAQRQAEAQGAPAAAVDTAARTAAEEEAAAATTPREGIQAALARIRADVQKTANASQRRAQVAGRRRVAQIQKGVDPAAIETAAKRFVLTLKVGDATPARYRQAAARLSIKIERAIASRDYATAADLMERRALNLAVAKEAAALQTKIEKQATRWRGLTRRSDKRLAQRYSLDWVNGIRVMLAPFNFASSAQTNYDAATALANLQQVEPTLYNEIQQTIALYQQRAVAAQNARPKEPHKDLSVQELLELFEAADGMLANARDSRALLIDGQRVEFESIAAEVAANVSTRRKVQKNRRKAAAGRGTRRAREVRRMLSDFKASLLRIEQWARNFDNGDPRGPLTRYLVRPVMRAVDAYTEARKRPQEALAALLRGRTDILRPRPIRAPELDNYTFQSKGELLMALLHTGNPSNLRKLLLGGARDIDNDQTYSWGEVDDQGELVTARWDQFMARMFDEGIITKEDMDLVQGIWDIFEQTKAAAQNAHKQMYGYYFTEVEAEPLVTPFGIYRGGYAPAVTDKMMNPDGNRFEAEEVLSQQSNAAMFPGAEKGFTQSRVEYNQPMDLDLSRIPAHFDRVMKFAYLGPAVRQAARLVTNKAFREAVRPGSPDVIDSAVIPWLQRTAQQRVTTPPTSGGWLGLGRVAAAIDRRVGLHIMAGNIVNAAQQITGFPVAAARIPARHLAAAMTQFKVNGQGTRAYITSQSPFMAERLSGGMNEAVTTLEKLLTDPGVLNKLQAAAMRYGYFAQQIAQNMVDPTVWLAAERHGMLTVYPDAYAEALERTGDEAAADEAARAEVIEYADSVVRDTQSPLRPSDVSGIEASSPLARLFLKFYSYFNSMGNLLNTEVSLAMNSEMGWKGRYGRAFYAYLMIVTIPSIVAESIAQLSRTGFDDLDEEDERDQLMFELLIGSQFQTLAGMVPFAGTVASTTYGIAVTDQVYDDRLSMSAGIGVTESTLQNTVRLIYAVADPETDVDTRRAIRTTLDAAGLALGLPTNWLSKPLSYAASVRSGDSEPEGMVDLVQGILSGKDGTER